MKTNKTLRFLSVAIFAIAIAIPAFASDKSAKNLTDTDKFHTVADMVQDYLNRTSQSDLKIESDASAFGQDKYFELPQASKDVYVGSITWRWTRQESFKDGAWLVQFYGRMISVKLGFIKGSFMTEPVYNIIPVAMVSDITDFDYGYIGTYPYILADSASCYNTPGGNFHFAFRNKNLTISKCVNGQPDSSFSRTITYEQWTAAWAQNAAKYCGINIPGYCFIPQYIFKGANMPVRYGFVASKGVPLSGDGLPADFIELFRKTNNVVHIPWSVNSPALKFTFKFVPNSWPFIWHIYQMAKEDMKEAGQSWKSDEQINVPLVNKLISPVTIPILFNGHR